MYDFSPGAPKTLLTWPAVIVGEVANFAAYAFAPAILVTPLGALSVLIGAVLGSYFLKEKLGTLGKLGCAICLIGSIIIILHAPPDKEIETIDKILHYAIQPGTPPMPDFEEAQANRDQRVPHFLLFSCSFCCGHDIPGCTSTWEEEPPHLHLDLLNRWIRVRHVYQGYRHCGQVDFRGQQPVYPSLDIRVHHLDRSLHSDSDELFQQGSGPILHFHVSREELSLGSRVNIEAVSMPCTMLHLPPLRSALHSSSTVDLTPQMPSILYHSSAGSW